LRLLAVPGYRRGLPPVWGSGAALGPLARGDGASWPAPRGLRGPSGGLRATITPPGSAGLFQFGMPHTELEYRLVGPASAQPRSRSSPRRTPPRRSAAKQSVHLVQNLLQDQAVLFGPVASDRQRGGFCPQWTLRFRPTVGGPHPQRREVAGRSKSRTGTAVLDEVQSGEQNRTSTSVNDVHTGTASTGREVSGHGVDPIGFRRARPVHG